MKKLLVVLFFVAKILEGHTQTYDEFFLQQETQKKYLLQQITALKMYSGYVEKGYAIARSGLNTIHEIKNGDFNLHHTFFNSLIAINPAIKKYSKVASIIAIQIFISKQVSKTIHDCRNAKQLTQTELNYLQQVFNAVLDDCSKNLDELIGLITDSELQMKNDERIERIDKLYYDMQDKNVFVQSFSHAAKGLIVERRNETYDIQIEKKLNGLQ